MGCDVSSSLLRCLCGRLLALGADAGELEGMAHPGVAALFGDLVLEAPHDAFFDWFDFMAGAADQVMMMVTVPVARTDFMPGRAVHPRDPLHQLLFLEDGNKPEHGRKVAAFYAHLLVNVGQGQRNGTRVEQSNDGDAPVCRAQAVLPQPHRGGDPMRNGPTIRRRLGC